MSGPGPRGVGTSTGATRSVVVDDLGLREAGRRVEHLLRVADAHGAGHQHPSYPDMLDTGCGGVGPWPAGCHAPSIRSLLSRRPCHGRCPHRAPGSPLPAPSYPSPMQHNRALMPISRRRLLGAVPLSAATAVLVRWLDSVDEGDRPVGLRAAGRLWDIPEAAWWRAIGDHPEGATGRMPAVGSQLPATSRTQRGIPVGGIGAGSFMVNLSGSFGPWHMDVGGDDSAGARWGSDADSGLENRFLSGGLPRPLRHARRSVRADPGDRGCARDVAPAGAGSGSVLGALPQGLVRVRGTACPDRTQTAESLRRRRRAPVVAPRRPVPGGLRQPG